MKRRLAALRRHLRLTDVVLAVLGVAGAVLFFLLLPGQHPHSAASYRLTETQVAEAARAFVGARGMTVPEEAVEEVRLRKNAALLDSLQQAVGRPQAVRLLKSEARGRLPAYHWQVTWQDEGEDEEDDYEAEVLLTVEGAVYGFSADHPPAQRTGPAAVNREALAYALEPEAALSAPDSTLARRLTFDLARADSVAAEAEDVLDRREAARLARFYLRQTALAGYTFRLDSAWTERQNGRQRATLRLWGDAFYGQRPRVDVTVTPAGALRGLETAFNPEAAAEGAGNPLWGQRGEAAPVRAEAEAPEEAEEDAVTLGIEADTVAGIVAGVLYVLLVLASIFLFFRRMNARLVDTGSALRDGLWGGFFAGAMVALLIGVSIFQDTPSFWIGLMVFSVAVVFTAAGGAFLIFLASGAMDSVARAAWPEKLTTLDLVRHGALRNVPVGRALGRGLAVAGLLLGATTLLLALFPQAAIDFGAHENGAPPDLVVSYFGFAFGAGAWTGLFLGLTVLLGVGTFLHRKAPAWLVVGGPALVVVLMQTRLVPMHPLGFDVLFGAVFSLGVAWAFWRYDFITAFTAYLLPGVLWITAAGWMVEGSPLAVDALLGFITAGIVGVLAFVGLLSGRTSTVIGTYVPSYIEELAEQQRLERDIEIAQEVQQSFLPRRMPQVEGLDIAAMCLPALEVGGDYYDFIEVAPGKLAVAIGDVSGKGIQAAFFMTLAKGFLQTLACEERGPAEVLCRLNTLFCRNALRGTFISMLYGVVDVEAGTFTFARAGHNPLLYRHRPDRPPGGQASGDSADQALEVVRPAGLAIGLTAGPAFARTIEERTVPLRPGDTLVLYTDGFSEAMDRAGEQFGEERLARCVRAAGESAGAVVRAVSEAVHRHVEAADRHDDMTMVVVRRKERVGVWEVGSVGEKQGQAAPTSPTLSQAEDA